MTQTIWQCKIKQHEPVWDEDLGYEKNQVEAPNFIKHEENNSRQLINRTNADAMK